MDEESNDLIIELRSLFGLVDLRNINHGVHDGGDVFLEGLAINEAAYCPDYLNFEVDLFFLLIVIRPRNHSHQQWNYQVQVVILGDTLELLDHLESLLPNMILFLLRLGDGAH